MFAIANKDNPNANKCELLVELAQGRIAFYAGETIYGTVHVNLRSKFGPNDTLRLHLLGEEHATYIYKTSSSSGSGRNRRTTTRTHNYDASKPIIALSFPLGGCLELG